MTLFVPTHGRIAKVPASREILLCFRLGVRAR